MIETVKRYSMLQRSALQDLYDYASITRDLPGCVVECGVANGGSAAVLWAAAGVERTLWLFDSFQGLPRPTEPDGGRAYAQHDYRSKLPEGWCRGDINNVQAVVSMVGSLNNVEIVPGWLAETLPEAFLRIGPIAALHIDVDFYEPTLAALSWLHPLVVTGGAVVVDDYSAWEGCKKAVDEFLQTVMVDDYHQIGSPVYWRKVAA